MRNSNNSNSTGGIGFVGGLTLIFITLKLIGIIRWSWAWVLSPIWISIGAFLGVLIGIILWGRGRK